MYFELDQAKSPLSPYPTDYLKFLVCNDLVDSYPQTVILLRLFLTLPIGISSAERAFSTLRRLKTHLRSTISQERLSNLAILATEKDISLNINLDNIIEQFAQVKARRGSII